MNQAAGRGRCGPAPRRLDRGGEQVPGGCRPSVETGHRRGFPLEPSGQGNRLFCRDRPTIPSGGSKGGWIIAPGKPAVQGPGGSGRCVVAVLGALGHEPFHDRGQGRRHRRGQVAHRARRVVLMPQQLLRPRPAREGDAAGEQVVQRAAEAVQIAANVAAGGIVSHFGGDEIRRPGEATGRVCFAYVPGPQVQGQAQVKDLDAPGGVRSFAVFDQ